MTAIKLTVFSIFCISLLSISCKKEIVNKSGTPEEIPTKRPTPPPPPPPVDSDCNYDIAQSVIESSGWTIFFGDEFETNLDKWDRWNSGAYNNELQLYRSSNATLEGGNLVIRANKETPAVTGNTNPYDQTNKNFDYTSARLESKTLISASASSPQVRIMARIKLPSGYGMWPAFWSYGDPWPTQGEIDILEARGQEDFKYQTNYFYGRAANRNLVRNAEGYISTNVSLQDCYHVYELIWSQNELKFYFDGVLVHTNSGGYVPNLFGKQEKITLNLAVGGDFFSNLTPSLIQTGTMYVDWVRVFVKG